MESIRRLLAASRRHHRLLRRSPWTEYPSARNNRRRWRPDRRGPALANDQGRTVGDLPHNRLSLLRSIEDILGKR